MSPNAEIAPVMDNDSAPPSIANTINSIGPCPRKFGFLAPVAYQAVSAKAVARSNVLT